MLGHIKFHFMRSARAVRDNILLAANRFGDGERAIQLRPILHIIQSPAVAVVTTAAPPQTVHIIINARRRY